LVPETIEKLVEIALVVGLMSPCELDVEMPPEAPDERPYGLKLVVLAPVLWV